MDGKGVLDSFSKLRILHTRRVVGRRSLTPMRSKHKRSVAKTRSSKVEAKVNVPLRKHTITFVYGKRNEKDAQEHSEDCKREGNQDSCPGGERQDQEKHSQVESLRDTENPEKSVHPGPVQALPELSEQTAVVQTSDETEIEAEVLS